MATTTTARPAPSVAPTSTPVLRRVLVVDAAVTGANGLAYLAGAPLIADLLDVSATVLRPLGAFLLAFAALLVGVATRPRVPVAAVRALVAGNLAWVGASVVAAVAGVPATNGWGTAWALAQAAVVAGFAAAQMWALGRR